MAISQNLFGGQAQSFAQLDSLPNPSYYYVASGSSDATPRLESGMLLDSLFRRSIRYIKQLMKDHPGQSLGLNYMLGKIATESGIETSAGSKALQYCIDNYSPNRVFDLSEAQEQLQLALQNK
ncbi:hypothetical protein [Reichenbachiella ulvae]|uniref:Uncharacterized protein n=1 Tax=Reichenbachiella ulvae TaxID=2980104 RepID=A0ABT3CZV8_9BACT|nr:hypothetical protein [Reichenbachiella ulvae]MCV9389167.1 hypothetical protein [Reichenbachiella ulvae]